jgi:hypothetical protein
MSKSDLSSYVKHALREFKAAGWVDENGKFDDEMQEMICNHVIKLLDVFHGEGHSGTSAHYTIDLFEKLAKFEPIAPLTGEDWEWNHVGELDGKLYQNNRCGRVFKDDTGAYDVDGKVFWEWGVDEQGEHYKTYFTSKDSRVYIEFPYSPKTEYVYSESKAD